VANLIVNHRFKGLLIDGNAKNIQLVKKYYANHPETKHFPPQAFSAMITAENVNGLLKENIRGSRESIEKPQIGQE
jgi:hypothetical protein